MKVSLNWVKKYIDLPKKLTPKQIAYDLTLRTVEVEGVENTKDKFHDIVVGKIKEVKDHPNADSLKICITDIGEEKPVQIVCGGSNLYKDELVVVSKPGSEVYWHGEDELVKIKETKMRGESSYGMICGATEVYLDQFFPTDDEREIVDLSGIDCKVGQNIADVIYMDDTVLEIDNKSLTNRPDLWGHYGIARELSAIYDVPLKELPKLNLDKNLPKYKVEVVEEEKCNRYTATEIENVDTRKSPLWMQAALINGGMRPINAIVDITNYVMMAVGQPSHAFDRSHVEGEKIIVRNAKKGEKLLLLDDNDLDLTEEDLVIADTKTPLGLAGIKGGKKDSILEDTTGVVLEIANFTASDIRKTDKRFDEKTDSSIRYEKGIDTERVEQGLALSLELFKEIFPESKIVSHTDNYPIKTKRAKISVSQEFLDVRLGKELDEKVVKKVLTSLGYNVEYKDKTYHVEAPVWRSTGDVSIKDDVMGDIARILSFESFDAKPLPVNFTHAVNQRHESLERKIKEYLAFRCGFNEIFTYPWVDEKYIKAAKIDTKNLVKLTTPPAPELVNLRGSLIPGQLEVIAKNLRYFDNFKIFEVAQAFEEGKYSPSTKEEVLPIHKKLVTASITGKDAKKIFYELKGVLEQISSYTHMEEIYFEHKEKPSWADKEVYLNIKLKDKTVGSLALVSVSTMSDSKIKRTNVAMFELNLDELEPLDSRTNKFKHLPQFPLVEKDLSILVDKETSWESIKKIIKSKVKEIEFIEEYHGEKIPKNKKSITFRVKLGNDNATMTNEEITTKMNSLIKALNHQCGAELREE